MVYNLPMDSVQVKQDSPLLMTALPVVADGITAVVLALFLGSLTDRMSAPNGWNAALLVLMYIVFCVGVYLIRKLLAQPEEGRWGPPAWFMDPKMRGLFAGLFGLLMMTTLAYQLGYFRSILDVAVTTMGEGDSSAFFLFAPGAWLGFSMLVILVMAFPVNATILPHTPRYTLVAALGLLFCNGMLVLAAAQGRAMVEALGRLGGITAVVATFVALVVSFLPARLIYQNKQPLLSGLLSFGLLIILTTWLAAV